MRISDWSSDVCSSDLFVNVSSGEVDELYDRLEASRGTNEYRIGEIYLSANDTPAPKCWPMPIASSNSCAMAAASSPMRGSFPKRSEERRVGKECVSK